jgi:sterol desaturase/sphingolipid hydroxylase (fatty acid hydroxylase superfamily)
MFGVVFLGAVLGYDVWFYLSHVMLHWPWLFRRVHRIHHERVVDLRWVDTYHGHWFESVFQGAGFLLPLAFGVGLDWRVTWAEWLAAFVFVNVRGMARHDARLVGWIGDHHVVHHRNPKVNYGEVWLDWLCGTLRRSRPAAGGSSGGTC